MSGLIHYLFSRPEYFVLVIGLDDAGKTVLSILLTIELNPVHTAHLQSPWLIVARPNPQCLLERLKAMNNPKYNALPPEKVWCPIHCLVLAGS